MRPGLTTILFGTIALLVSVSGGISIWVGAQALSEQKRAFGRANLSAEIELVRHAMHNRCEDRTCVRRALRAILLHRRYALIDQNYETLLGDAKLWSPLRPWLQDVLTTKSDIILPQDAAQGVSVLKSLSNHRFIAHDPMVLVLEQSLKTSNVFREFIHLIWLQIAHLFLILLVGWYLVRRNVLLPIRELRHWIQTQIEGNDAAQLPRSNAPSEVKDLNRAFRSLLDTVRQQEKDLVDSQRQAAITTAQLAHREKLVTVGRVAAGVAHEVGNPLSVALGYVSLLKADRKDIGGDDDDLLESLDTELERIRIALRRLLNLSRPTEVKCEYFSVSSVVQDLNLWINVRAKNLEFRSNFSGQIDDQVYFDPEILLQILSNLCLNAAEAMDGEGWIELRPLRRTESRFELSIVDNGPGIEPSIRDRLFDAFQTTKTAQGGTGLGLSISKSLAELCGGELCVSQVGEGSGAVFILSLPISEADK